MRVGFGRMLPPETTVLSNVDVVVDPTLAGEAKPVPAAMRGKTEPPSLEGGGRRGRIRGAVDLHRTGSAGAEAVAVENGDGDVMRRHARIEQRTSKRGARLADRRTALKSNGRHLNPRGGPRS